MSISCFCGLSAIVPHTYRVASFLIQFPPRIRLLKLVTPTMKLLRLLFYRVITKKAMQFGGAAGSAEKLLWEFCAQSA